MSESWDSVKTVCCKPWLVLPTVYSDALSYGEQLDKFCYSLNKVIENNNILPEYVAEKIKEYISSGAIGEVVREILANYILNVKYPPKGIAPAVGDGSSDDTESLQGCIDYAAENGGVVYFPYGSYLTQSLTMKNGVSLFGFDRYSTKIVLKGGATKALLNGNGNNISVCNLTLDGNSGIQVNDVNVVDMTGSNLMFNDLVIKDGYKLFNFTGDGHLQLSNIVFGNAVENCFTVDGNVIVQTNNLLFTALSKVGGVSVIDIRANGGSYDFNSVAKCDTCMLISGNDNKVVALIGGANEDYVDTGEHNNVEIVGHSKKKYYSNAVNIEANNHSLTVADSKTETITGNRDIKVGTNDSLHINGISELSVSGIRTEDYKNDKNVTVGGNATEDYKNDKNVTIGGNATEDYKNDKNVTIGGNATEDYKNDKNVTIGGNATEDYKNDKNVTIGGNATENFKNKNTTFTEKWIIHTPERDINVAKLPQLSVLDFGALGDGVTDDTNAIMSMINKVGYALFLPGTYKCNLTITMTCALIGYETSKTILSAFNENKDVVQVLKTAPYFKVENLTMQGGVNGLNIIEGIGNQIVGCIFKNNSSSGLKIVNKNTSINSALTHIDRCYAELNKTNGFYIENFADWSMTDCEGVSNASKMGDTTGANLTIKDCAGKILNSHFWNYNDNFGYFRPASSVTLINSPSEFTNCHIEGGYTVNLSINNSSPTFVNCLIYASFGATSIWMDNSPRCRFIGCDLQGQAIDNVSYKPDWLAIFGGGSIQGVLQDCYVIGQLFTNNKFTDWKIDINSYSPNDDIMERINEYTDVRVRGSKYNNINLDTFAIGGGNNVSLNEFNGAWVTSPTLTLSGSVYAGKTFLIGNAGTSDCTVTTPVTLLTGNKTFTIPSKKSVLCFFTKDTCFVVGLQ